MTDLEMSQALNIVFFISLFLCVVIKLIDDAKNDGRKK